MARRRTKSAQDINEQSDRLFDQLLYSGQRNEEILPRMERIRAINQRYSDNISRSFGERDGWISNENYGKQVSRSTYMGLNAG